MTDPQRRSVQPRVFISHSARDRARAQELIGALRMRNVELPLDSYQLEYGKELGTSIHDTIAASSYFLLLLSSDSLTSKWMAHEVNMVLDELSKRDITILPVLLEDCELPPQLASYRWFDMRHGMEQELDRLADALRLAPTIDFESLSPLMFERLVADLLQRLGFESIRSQAKEREQIADFVADYRREDPFGGEIVDTYMIETKLYRHSRADLRSLNQLLGLTLQTPGIRNAVLVTNSKLTSVALDWIDRARVNSGVALRVIDGSELKRLLLQHNDLLATYFPANEGDI